MGFFMGFPFGEARRNQPVKLNQANPLPANNQIADCGDAGFDGYTVLSRANRMTDERPAIGGTPDYWGPNQDQEQ